MGQLVDINGNANMFRILVKKTKSLKPKDNVPNTIIWNIWKCQTWFGLNERSSFCFCKEIVNFRLRYFDEFRFGRGLGRQQ
jgi:hypothetical protein